MKDITMEDIMAKMKAKHPNLSDEKIKKIIKEGCMNLTGEIKKGKDVQIRAFKNGTSFLVFKPHSNKNR